MLGLSLLVQTAASHGNTGVGPLAPALERDLVLSGSQLGLIVPLLMLMAGGAVTDPGPNSALTAKET